jgi:uncharacterized damage-inducible protein DinB
MNQKELFLTFWEREGPTTRKVISRIPQENSEYKPEPKSRTAREIAWLLVVEDKVLVEGLESGKIEWQDVPTPATVQEILDTYDRHHADLSRRLKQLDPGKWEKEIPFVWQGQEIMKSIGYDFAWGFLFDQVHHRGQLSTYLRPMGSTVPAIYGPSADEQS